ncbi:hypothetical protein GCM10018793_54730 [Streptomyces sulfonofaciens]|uniref:Uncharacterized protein n=1 Tax=Streptomyces sulfonofaciens TaxID=68272 RepID=A0A919GKJ6_9ACTN|nr:hypothetical protein [Streptomyces sulfonofaciens]GHH85698.1 hypothetical protein GCM10018793_54730 [Streptomyces sulfonofaciens]
MDMGHEHFERDESGALYIQELALFVFAHLGRAPGILWPEHDHPALRPQAGPEELALLAEGLSRATGLPVRTCRLEPVGAGLQTGSARRHCLFHQTAGTGKWWLLAGPADSAGAGSTAFRTYRLRVSEILYVPVHWTWLVDLAPGGRLIHTCLGPADDPSPTD